MYLPRATLGIIVAFWLVSMAWLTRTHWQHIESAGRGPSPQRLLPASPGRLAPLRWRIEWNGTPLGWAEQQVERYANGEGTIHSTVRIERLDWGQLWHQGSSNGWGSQLARSIGANIAGGERISVTVKNQMRFDEFAQLRTIVCDMRDDRWGEWVRFEGTVHGDQLIVRAQMPNVTAHPVPSGTKNDEPQTILQTKVRLPRNGVVVDALSPQPRLHSLAPGQSWTYQTYQPLSPMNPMRTVTARVIGRETITVSGQRYDAWHVTCEGEHDSLRSLDRHLGDLWVQRDGVVLRQTLQWGDATLSFERDDRATPEATAVEDHATGDTLRPTEGAQH